MKEVRGDLCNYVNQKTSATTAALRLFFSETEAEEI